MVDLYLVYFTLFALVYKLILSTTLLVPHVGNITKPIIYVLETMHFSFFLRRRLYYRQVLDDEKCDNANSPEAV